MELILQTLPFASSYYSKLKESNLKGHNAFEGTSCFYVMSKKAGDRMCPISSALPETAASIAVAATVVGAAATLLRRRSAFPESTEATSKICEDCGGSGICPECNGEGFVLKQQPKEIAERARMTAKNMATRFTAGLPKKWGYCTRCSSSRSCTKCGGRGNLSF